jgi:RNA polymerase sigma-70 factor (ECF subfamily)
VREQEHELLERARRGDDAAFHRLVAPYRRQLQAHCRRMLACSHDAEDAMQETMLRAWRSLATFQGQAAIGSWLYRIATNCCLTAIDKRPKGTVSFDCPLEPYPDEIADHPNSTETDYEQQEAAALALEVTLRHLPANQRAALLLCQVLGFPAREAAAALGTSVASVNSALQRARVKVDECPEPVRDERLRDAVDGFVSALARGDVGTLVGIAAEETIAAERSWTYSPVPAY